VFSFSKQMPGWNLKLEHAHILPHFPNSLFTFLQSFDAIWSDVSYRQCH
jgi:hypothetical protein